jgi:hypothetical protein
MNLVSLHSIGRKPILTTVGDDHHNPKRPWNDSSSGRGFQRRCSAGNVSQPHSLFPPIPWTSGRVADSSHRLLVRAACGPLCDRFGPRWVFIMTLICGAVPVALAGLITNPQGLIALRFFVGVLGATFVPCQVWCTGFFDKSVVGTANGLAAGWGNAGGGVA